MNIKNIERHQRKMFTLFTCIMLQCIKLEAYLMLYSFSDRSVLNGWNLNRDRVDFSHVSFYMNYNCFSKESEESRRHNQWILILKNIPNICQSSANMTKSLMVVYEFHTCQLYISTIKIFRHDIDGFVQLVHVLKILLHNRCLYTNIRGKIYSKFYNVFSFGYGSVWILKGHSVLWLFLEHLSFQWTNEAFHTFV